MVKPNGKREQILISLPVRFLVEGLNLVHSGRYSSLDEVVEDALRSFIMNENAIKPAVKKLANAKPPLAIEENNGNGAIKTKMLALIDCVKYEKSETVTPTTQSKLATSILPITVHRFLPVKFALVITITCMQKWKQFDLPLGRLIPHIVSEAESWDVYLKELDDAMNRPRGERLSTTFPNHADGTGKSSNRFIDSIFGGIMIDGRQSGALPYLRFAYLSMKDKEVVVGLTKEGIEFASISNLVLHEGKNQYPPFSTQEKDYLLTHMMIRCPREIAHMVHFLKTLRGSPNSSRIDINRQMRTFYETIWNPLDLSNSLVDSMRGGVNSRCGELGLANTKRDGVHAFYNATEDGLHWLDKIEKSWKN